MTDTSVTRLDPSDDTQPIVSAIHAMDEALQQWRRLIAHTSDTTRILMVSDLITGFATRAHELADAALIKAGRL